jgi:EpsI family protein
MSIAALYIYIYFRSVTRALIFFIVCVGLAVVYNWFRAVVIVIIGHLSEMQSPLVSSHRSLGWALFVSVIILMFLVGAWLKRDETRSENDRAGSLFLGNPASAAARSSVIGMAFTVLLIVGIGFTTAARMKGRVPEHYTVIPPEGIQIPGWSGTLSEQVDWQPMSVGADASWISVYGNGDKRVSLYVAYYFRQTQGKELINDRNRLYDRTVWTLVGRSRLRLNTDKEVNLEVIETKLSGPGDRLRTLWHWYEIGGHTTASPSVAKLYQVGGLIRGRPGAAAVAIALDHSNTNGEHRETLRRFALSLDPVLSQALRKMVVREP